MSTASTLITRPAQLATLVAASTHTHTHWGTLELHLRRPPSSVCPCQLQLAEPAGYWSQFPSDDSRPNEPQSVNVTERRNKKQNRFEINNSLLCSIIIGFIMLEVCTHWHRHTHFTTLLLRYLRYLRDLSASTLFAPTKTIHFKFTIATEWGSAQLFGL